MNQDHDSQDQNGWDKSWKMYQAKRFKAFIDYDLLSSAMNVAEVGSAIIIEHVNWFGFSRQQLLFRHLVT